jgi:hypothetical protein
VAAAGSARRLAQNDSVLPGAVWKDFAAIHEGARPRHEPSAKADIAFPQPRIHSPGADGTIT